MMDWGAAGKGAPRGGVAPTVRPSLRPTSGAPLRPVWTPGVQPQVPATNAPQPQTLRLANPLARQMPPKAAATATPGVATRGPPAQRGAPVATTAPLARPPAGAAAGARPPAAAPQAAAEGESTIEMKNFPDTWLAANAKTPLEVKIKTLLNRVGRLKEAPVIDRSSGTVVVTAKFEKREHAEKAVTMLHGVDSRTETEKTAAFNREPRAHEKFHVQVVDCAAKPRSVPSQHILLSNVPPEWPPSRIQDLCSPFGIVDSVTPGVAGQGFVVSYRSASAAAEACKSLSIMHIPNEAGGNSMAKCEMISEDMAAATTEVPVVIYVDELQLSTFEPGAGDREIYLRDLPVEDYGEEDLRNWLDDFGAVEQTIFSMDLTTKKLTGTGYVRFATKEEADGLLAAFGENTEGDGNVTGGWSLSEQILKGKQGPMKADILPLIRSKLRNIQQGLGLKHLHLVGSLDGADSASPPWLTSFGRGLEGGPLHFICSQKHKMGTTEALRTHLAKVLKLELTGKVPMGAAKPTPKSGSERAGVMPNQARVGAGAVPAKASASKPCIVVRGFAPSWTEKEARLVFAVFGGVSSVTFSEDVSGRVARVELKNPDNLRKAVDQLNNTQVGDGELIEECTIACHIEGGLSSSQHWSVFVDELPMSKRPDVRPKTSDCEVFLESLPVRDCTQDDIVSFLESYGGVEELHLLKDKLTGKPSGKGYVRFKSHQHAAACVEAQQAPKDSEDIRAQWSESERAYQMRQSVYGDDVHSAFSLQSLEQVKKASMVQSLWMLSEKQRPSSGAPKPEAKYLHFMVSCRQDQVDAVKAQLGKVLDSFHQGVSRSLQKVTSASSKRAREDRGADDELSGPPPGQWQPAKPRAAPWAGQQPPPGVLHDPSWGGMQPQGAGGKGGPAAAGPCWSQPPSGETSAPLHVPKAPACPSRATTPADATRVTQRGREKDQLDVEIEKGEALFLEGRALQDEDPKKAFETMSSGLKVLVQVMKSIQDEERSQSLRTRLDEYLHEAERLKPLTSGDARSAKPSREDRGQEQAGQNDRGPGRSHARTPRLAQDVETKLEKGKSLLKEGDALDVKKRYSEAYTKHTQGMQLLLQVLEALEKANQPEFDGLTADVRKKVEASLAKAAKLKEIVDGGNGSRNTQRHRSREERGDRDDRSREQRRPEAAASHRSSDARRDRDRRGTDSDGRHGRRSRSPHRQDGGGRDSHTSRGAPDRIGLRSRSRTEPHGSRRAAESDRGDRRSRDEVDRGRDGYRDRQRTDSRGRGAHLSSPVRPEPDDGARATRCKAPGPGPQQPSQPPPAHLRPGNAMLRPKAGAGNFKAAAKRGLLQQRRVAAAEDSCAPAA